MLFPFALYDMKMLYSQSIGLVLFARCAIIQVSFSHFISRLVVKLLFSSVPSLLLHVKISSCDCASLAYLVIGVEYSSMLALSYCYGRRGHVLGVYGDSIEFSVLITFLKVQDSKTKARGHKYEKFTAPRNLQITLK